MACRFCGQPSRQDTWRLTGLCSGAQRGTREGWGDLMAGSVWKCLHSHHADTADCQLALLPTCRWQPPFQMPSCGLAVWSLHVGLFGLLYRKAGEFHCESKKRSGQKKLCMRGGEKNINKACLSSRCGRDLGPEDNVRPLDN